MLTKNELKQLRNEIVLNSILLKDYSNSLYISEKTACSFFDSFIDYIYNEYSNGLDFNEVLEQYDNIDVLYDYYIDCCINGYDRLLKDDYIGYIFIGIGYSIVVYAISDYDITVATLENDVRGNPRITKITTNRLYYDNTGNAYFMKYGYKYYIDEIVKKDR